MFSSMLCLDSKEMRVIAKWSMLMSLWEVCVVCVCVCEWVSKTKKATKPQATGKWNHSRPQRRHNLPKVFSQSKSFGLFILKHHQYGHLRDNFYSLNHFYTASRPYFPKWASWSPLKWVPLFGVSEGRKEKVGLPFHFFLPVLNESLFNPRHFSSTLTKERAEELSDLVEHFYTEGQHVMLILNF